MLFNLHLQRKKEGSVFAKNKNSLNSRKKARTAPNNTSPTFCITAEKSVYLKKSALEHNNCPKPLWYNEKIKVDKIQFTTLKSDIFYINDK
jgi:hypothetical protein